MFTYSSNAEGAIAKLRNHCHDKRLGKALINKQHILETFTLILSFSCKIRSKKERNILRKQNTCGIGKLIVVENEGNFPRKQ